MIEKIEKIEMRMYRKVLASDVDVLVLCIDDNEVI